MNEKKHKDTEEYDYNEITDDQEKLYSEFNSIWSEKRVTSEGLNKKIYEFRILKYILYTLIITGVIFFIFLVSLNFHYIIMIIDIGMVVVYFFYFIFIKRRYSKYLIVLRGESVNKKKEISIIQLTSYSLIFISTIFILIISIIGLNLFDLILIVGISFLFIYLDSRNENGNSY